MFAFLNEFYCEMFFPVKAPLFFFMEVSLYLRHGLSDAINELLLRLQDCCTWALITGIKIVCIGSLLLPSRIAHS